MALLGWGCIICFLAAAGTIAEAVQVMVWSTAVLGRSVLLSTSLNSTQLQSMKWSVKKEDSKTVRILTAENKTQPQITPPFLQRVELLKNGSMLLRNVTGSDQGVYTVTVTDWDGTEETETITLTVSAAVVINSLSASPDSPSMGDNVTLSCRVSGGTQRSVSWLKDGDLLPNKTLAHLSLPTLAPSHCGLYTCLAQDAFSSDQADYRLTAPGCENPFSASIALVACGVVLVVIAALGTRCWCKIHLGACSENPRAGQEVDVVQSPRSQTPVELEYAELEFQDRAERPTPQQHTAPEDLSVIYSQCR
ncbi:hepatocyte cell adhesion molecule-like [Polyodon spathula]|uniref:hepatocyte cell adhesion molecule-like n=1 Tax=Polyodon spathula TaxID=7913 RepID=UPI001B7F506D|nr:hepatocyte cell adhesion molecule-like [Polyodon spathula]